jgi:acyl-CoA dehydrogenase
VNGQKTFISGADESAYLFTVARSAALSSPGGRAALSVLMVPVKARGIDMQPLDIEIIQPDRQFTVFMDEVEVEDGALVGGDGAGASVMFDALNTERLLVAAMALGLGEYALGKAVAYARERAPFGRPIGAYQGIQHRLARAKAHLEAARAVLYGASEGFDRGEPVGPACSMAKLLASEAGVEACDAAIQVHGGYAFDAGYDVSTIWPLVRLFCIAPLNNEMVLNSIGQHVLGLPKSY